jgi:hypothetical protein
MVNRKQIRETVIMNRSLVYEVKNYKFSKNGGLNKIGNK